MWYLKKKDKKEARFCSIKDLENFFENLKKERKEFADIIVFKCSNYLVINSSNENRIKMFINEASKKYIEIYKIGFLTYFEIHQ